MELALALSEELPVERCLQSGARCLSFRELVSLVLGSGPRDVGTMALASELLERAGPGLSPADQERAFFTAMELSSPAMLAGLRGLSDGGQARVLAAFELGRRYCVFRAPPRTRGRKGPARNPSPEDLRNEVFTRVPLTLRFEPAEWLGFVPLHRTGILGELCVVERGVRTHVNTDPAELFSRVLALRPHGFFLLHNHPSGNLSPSLSDLELTRRVGDLARQLGVRLLGHAIVTGSDQRWIVV